jgi:hypothetical protein
MQPATRSARVLPAALLAGLVAVLVSCGVALSGASGAYAAPSRMPQHSHALPDQHVATAHAHRVTIVTPRTPSHQRYGGSPPLAASLSAASSSVAANVITLEAVRLASPLPHHLAPPCARAPPV